MVAGSRVHDGKISRDQLYRVIRDERVIQEGLKLSNLKKFKEDVNDVDMG